MLGNGWTIDVIAYIFSYRNGRITMSDEKKITIEP